MLTAFLQKAVNTLKFVKWDEYTAELTEWQKNFAEFTEWCGSIEGDTIPKPCYKSVYEFGKQPANLLLFFQKTCLSEIGF